MDRIKLMLNSRKPDNYAFYCPSTNLHLTRSNPVGYVDRVASTIFIAVKSGALIDVDGVIDLETGELKIAKKDYVTPEIVEIKQEEEKIDAPEPVAPKQEEEKSEDPVVEDPKQEEEKTEELDLFADLEIKEEKAASKKRSKKEKSDVVEQQ